MEATALYDYSTDPHESQSNDQLSNGSSSHQTDSNSQNSNSISSNSNLQNNQNNQSNQNNNNQNNQTLNFSKGTKLIITTFVEYRDWFRAELDVVNRYEDDQLQMIPVQNNHSNHMTSSFSNNHNNNNNSSSFRQNSSPMMNSNGQYHFPHNNFSSPIGSPAGLQEYNRSQSHNFPSSPLVHANGTILRNHSRSNHNNNNGSNKNNNNHHHHQQIRHQKTKSDYFPPLNNMNDITLTTTLNDSALSNQALNRENSNNFSQSNSRINQLHNLSLSNHIQSQNSSNQNNYHNPTINYKNSTTSINSNLSSTSSAYYRKYGTHKTRSKQILKGLVPKNYFQVKPCPWFYGPITRESADQILINCCPGEFLVRQNSKTHQFVLSAKLPGRSGNHRSNSHGSGQIKHYKILRDQMGNFLIFKSKFNSINKLVDYYFENSLPVAPSRTVSSMSHVNDPTSNFLLGQPNHEERLSFPDRFVYTAQYSYDPAENYGFGGRKTF